MWLLVIHVGLGDSHHKMSHFTLWQGSEVTNIRQVELADIRRVNDAKWRYNLDREAAMIRKAVALMETLDRSLNHNVDPIVHFLRECEEKFPADGNQTGDLILKKEEFIASPEGVDLGKRTTPWSEIGRPTRLVMQL